MEFLDFAEDIAPRRVVRDNAPGLATISKQGALMTMTDETIAQIRHTHSDCALAVVGKIAKPSASSGEQPQF